MFPGDGTGKFGTGWNFRVAAPTKGNLSVQLEVGSFDRDARDDFVIALDKLVVVNLSGTSGPGWYAQWTETFLPRSIVVADFNADGLDDVAVSGAGVKLYLNTGKSFKPASSFAAGAELHAIDLDSDGGMDLVTTIETPSTGLQMLAVKKGSITMGAYYGTGVFPFEHPMTVVGDIDRDKDHDIVVFTEKGEYVVLRASGKGVFSVEKRAKGGPATDFADIDGDGDLDGLCCGGGGPSTPRNTAPAIYRISLGDGKGGFAPAVEILGRGARRLAGAVDMDRDGDLDLVAGRCVFFHAGSFARTKQTVAPVLKNDRGFADADGDGDPDLAPGSNSVLRNDGAGSFSASVPLVQSPPPGTSFVGPGYRGDFDGDGDVDLIVGHVKLFQLLSMRLLVNNGGGGFGDGGPASGPGANFNVNGSIFRFDHSGVVADMDGDGDQDIVSTGSTWRNIVWLNNGRGFFTKKTEFTGGVAAKAADLDGDKAMDLVVAGNYVVIYWGRGDGTFGSTKGLSSRVLFLPSRLDAGDVDGDGDIDIVATGNDGRTFLWRNEVRARWFNPYSLPSTDYGTKNPRQRVRLADLNADRKLDLILFPSRYGGSSALILANDGAGSFKPIAEQVVDEWAMADVDGDGDPDLVADRIVLNRRFRRPNGGYRLQYGKGTAGLGGMVPVLGGSGPFRVGSSAVTHLKGARGASIAVLVISSQRAELPDFPFPGLTGYALPTAAVSIPLTGPPNGVGTGGFDISYVVHPLAYGVTIYQQCFVLDAAAPYWLAQTNGLMLRYGK